MENLTLFPLYQTTCFFIPFVAPCTPLLIDGDTKKAKDSSEEKEALSNVETPQETLECVYRELKHVLKDELLNRIHEKFADVFVKLVVLCQTN